MAKKPAKKTRAKATRKNQPARRMRPMGKKPVKSRSSTKAAGAPSPSAKGELLNRMAREHQTTLRVMRAFPADQGGFQPHPRSQRAKELMWTFVAEQALSHGALDGEIKFQMTPAPETIEEIIAAYDEGVRGLIARVEKTPDRHFGRTVKFMVGPGQVGDIPAMDLLWLMLMDAVHHRGQLSVYLRMAGGKVPSIYGPSADEPWH
jgi:uncharacterized damage-inducible protein DinB